MTSTPVLSALDIARDAVRALDWHRSCAGGTFFAFTGAGTKIIHLPGAGQVPSLYLAERADGTRIPGGWANALGAFLAACDLILCDACDELADRPTADVTDLGRGVTFVVGSCCQEA